MQVACFNRPICNEWSAFAGLEPAQFSNQQDMFLAALAANARRVREGISAYRADWVRERHALACISLLGLDSASCITANATLPYLP